MKRAVDLQWYIGRRDAQYPSLLISGTRFFPLPTVVCPLPNCLCYFIDRSNWRVNYQCKMPLFCYRKSQEVICELWWRGNDLISNSILLLYPGFSEGLMGCRGRAKLSIPFPQTVGQLILKSAQKIHELFQLASEFSLINVLVIYK